MPIAIVTGPSCSGKSHLARRMAAKIPNLCAIISTDAYYRGDSNDFEDVSSIDFDALITDIKTVERGQWIYRRRYQMRGARNDLIESPIYKNAGDAPILEIVEGIFAPSPILVIVEGIFAHYVAPYFLHPYIYVCTPRFSERMPAKTAKPLSEFSRWLNDLRLDYSFCSSGDDIFLCDEKMPELTMLAPNLWEVAPMEIN